MVSQKKKIKKYSDDNAPSLDLSTMPPYPAQAEFIFHKARWKFIAFGRQSGKSWGAKYMLLDRAINRHQRCWWVFPVYKTAEDHWLELINFLRRSKFPVKKINLSEKRIDFYGGGYIVVRSADKPDNLRGGTLDFIVMDEAAFCAEEVWVKVLQPMLTASRGDALIISTPNGRNWFYTQWLLGQDERYKDFYSKHMTSLESPYQDVETLEIIRTTLHELVWREEYLAEFLADGGGVFTGVEKAAKVAAYRIPSDKEIRTYVAGVDWGATGDYTAFTVICKQTREQVYGERFTSYGTTDTINRVMSLLYAWVPEVTYVESNGIGVPLLALLKEKLTGEVDDIEEMLEDIDRDNIYGGFRIRSVHLNNERKRAVIERLAVDIEWGRLFLLAETQPDMALDRYAKTQISEMSTFNRDRTKTGLVTYGAAEGSHDDTVMALALSYMGMPNKRKFKKHWLKSSGTPEPRNNKSPFKSSRSYANAKRR